MPLQFLKILVKPLITQGYFTDKSQRAFQPLKVIQQFFQRNTTIRPHLLHTDTFQTFLHRIPLQMHHLRHARLG